VDGIADELLIKTVGGFSCVTALLQGSKTAADMGAICKLLEKLERDCRMCSAGVKSANAELGLTFDRLLRAKQATIDVLNKKISDLEEKSTRQEEMIEELTARMVEISAEKEHALPPPISPPLAPASTGSGGEIEGESGDD
jgi:hypothetical protein